MLAHTYPSLGRYAKLASQPHASGDASVPATEVRSASDSERLLGRCWWILLHALAESYPESATYQERSNWFRFVELMAALHPVLRWRAAASKLIRNSPPNVSNKTAFTEWAVEVHNAVSVSLGRPTVDVHSWSKNLVVPKPTKAEIGRAVWQLLYGLAVSYPVVPDQQTQRMITEFMNLIGSVYPCVDCRTSFAVILARHPPCSTSQQGLSAWIAKVHQCVNAQLGKPVQPPPVHTANGMHPGSGIGGMASASPHLPRVRRAGTTKELADERSEAAADLAALTAPRDEPSMSRTWTEGFGPGTTFADGRPPTSLRKSDVDWQGLSIDSGALRTSAYARVPAVAAARPFTQQANSTDSSVYASRAREAFQLYERKAQTGIVPHRSSSAIPPPTRDGVTWRVPNRGAGYVNPSRNCRVCRG